MDFISFLKSICKIKHSVYTLEPFREIGQSFGENLREVIKQKLFE